MAKKISINIIGGGNVATHLIREFLKHPEIHINQLYSRNLDQIKEFEGVSPMINDLKLIKPADISIISISDDAIEEISKHFKHYKNLVVHTAGSIEIDKIHSIRKGVFYPFQTFSKQKKEIEFKSIPILIEAENEQDLNLLKHLGKIISNDVLTLNSQQRKALHLAGVLVSNFVNHLYVRADELLEKNNLEFDILKPLIQEVTNKIMQLKPIEAQTGPALRNDKKIIKKHLDFINDKNLKEIYTLITNSIQNKSNNEK